MSKKKYTAGYAITVFVDRPIEAEDMNEANQIAHNMEQWELVNLILSKKAEITDSNDMAVVALLDQEL